MKKISICIGLLITIGLMGGCGNRAQNPADTTEDTQTESAGNAAVPYQSISTSITELENGFSVVKFEGDYGFDDFLEQGDRKSVV